VRKFFYRSVVLVYLLAVLAINSLRLMDYSTFQDTRKYFGHKGQHGYSINPTLAF
jgi:hypothetical protein